MSKNVVSGCSGLKLLRCSEVLRFATVSSTTLIVPKFAPYIVGEIPGTLQVQHTVENGIYKKNISFEYRGLTPTDADMFEALRRLKFIAIYTDETGRQKVCGSKSYPLTMEYITSEGAFSVVLTGVDTRPDTFLLM